MTEAPSVNATATAAAAALAAAVAAHEALRLNFEQQMAAHQMYAQQMSSLGLLQAHLHFLAQAHAAAAPPAQPLAAAGVPYGAPTAAINGTAQPVVVAAVTPPSAPVAVAPQQPVDDSSSRMEPPPPPSLTISPGTLFFLR